jgi:uncharacterized protein YlbG (UPF0298 family)
VDYLKEMRKKRELEAGGDTNYSRKINEYQINKLMNDDRLNDIEKLDAVKRLVN